MTSSHDAPVALITGANKGIGFEIVRGLAQQGVRVLLGSRDAERGRQAASQLAADGLDVTPIRLDVTDPASLEQAVREIEARPGRLDILVNNAGIATGDRPAEQQNTLATVRDVFETNLFGVIAVIQAFLPLLQDSPAGRIVNVSSRLGSLAMLEDPANPWAQRMLLAYGPSKTALNAVTLQYANALRHTPIKVNAACPGHCDTDLSNHLGARSAAQGAMTPIRLALLPAGGPTGGFFDDAGVVPW